MLIVLWSLAIAVLPFNLTYFIGIESVAPFDFLVPLILLFSLPALLRKFPKIIRTDWPVFLWYLAFAVT